MGDICQCGHGLNQHYISYGYDIFGEIDSITHKHCEVIACLCKQFDALEQNVAKDKCICTHIRAWHSEFKDKCAFMFCPCNRFEEEKMKETMTRRFYASKSAIDYKPILKTLGEAIEDAKSRMKDGGYEEYYVVEVVKVVRYTPPKEATVEVIEVRRD